MLSSIWRQCEAKETLYIIDKYFIPLSRRTLDSRIQAKLLYWFSFLDEQCCMDVLSVWNTSFLVKAQDRFLSSMLKWRIERLGKPVQVPFPRCSLLMQNSDLNREGDLLQHCRCKSFLSVAGKGSVPYPGETAGRKHRGICYGRACPVSGLQKDKASSWWASYCTDGNEPLRSPSTIISRVPETQEETRSRNTCFFTFLSPQSFFSLIRVWFW